MKVETNLHDGKATVLQLVYLSQEFENFQQNAISLTNLERLGIITFKKDTFLANDSEYCFSITDFGQSFIEACVI